MPLACLTLLCLLLARADAPIGPERAGFTEAPLFVPLFTPRAAPAGTYRTYVSSASLDTILSRLATDRSLGRGHGSFEPQALVPADAFGQSGGYNRWRLALLYGAQRARVARGPRLDQGRVIDAWTLISPYPDAELERLNPGTLLIVLRPPP